ncbi:unnamed protein product [Candida verbasci]|uniref:Cytochrome b-c1 complex subunit 2, mitochondrial n=1 Tax=Candida verbasci TaxID=1227364 RepID=A0A9W4XET5_9ASCO|nr:unnamed protein product [Candida verbasci]
MLSRTSIRAYSSIPNSIKIASKEQSINDLTSLSIKIKNSGSSVGKFGISHLLSKFAFLNNGGKSALRFVRESELLGGVFSSQVTRDALILKASFLKADLPYYVSELGNIVSNTKFTPHEFKEVVLPAANYETQQALNSSSITGLEKIHEISFRKGYGNPLYYNSSTPISLNEIVQFSKDQFVGENIEILAEGANEADLTKFVEESAFCYLPSSANSLKPEVKFYTSQETRHALPGQSTAIIGVPVKTSEFGKYELLSATIGTKTLPSLTTPLSKIEGASSHLYKYENAGLFVIEVTNSSAEKVANGIKDAKKVLESITKEDLSKSVKSADLSIALQDKFDAPLNIKVTPERPSFKEFNYVAIGDLDKLPYKSDL